MTRAASTAWPTPFELVNAPELAILAVLEGTLELLGRVLACAHPELLDTDVEDDHRYKRLPAAALVADQLLVHAQRMLAAIREYRTVANPAKKRPIRDDDIPF